MNIKSRSRLVGLLSLSIAVAVTMSAFGNPGDLDTNFAGTGLVRFGFGGGPDYGNAVTVQSDGSLLLGGSSTVNGTSEFSLVRLTTSNVLDTTFGNGGKVLTPASIPGLSSSSASINSFGIQSDGKIVAGGVAYNNSNYASFALVRYLTNGVVDPSFGTNGIVFTDFHLGSTLSAIAIQSDGKIVAVGYTDYPADAGEAEFALARYQTNGALDSTFGSGGTVLTAGVTGYSGARAVMLPSGGTIVAAGMGIGSGHNGADFAVYRYTTNGVLDTTFGSGTGKVFTQISTNGNNEYIDYANAISYESGNGVIGDPDKYVVAGTYWNLNTEAMVVVMARYNLDGTPDTGFGTNGIVYTPLPGSISSGAQALFISETLPLRIPKLTVAGSSFGGPTNYFAVARYSGTGTFDTTFGPNGTGVGVIPIPATYSANVSAAAIQSGEYVLVGSQSASSSVSDYAVARFNSSGSADTNFGTNGEMGIDIADLDSHAQGVAIQSDGKIITAGSANNGTNDIFALVRCNPDGSFDSTFGSNGKVTTLLGSGATVFDALQIQTDGKIVAAGGANNEFAVARYTTNGALDTSYGTSGVTNTLPAGTAAAMVLQGDGKAVLAGSVNSHYGLARYTTNGALDTSFGGVGYVTTSIGSEDEVTAVRTQADGKIVAAGASVIGTTSIDASLVRYQTNGALDTTWGTLGRVTTDFGAGNGGIIYGLAIQPNGRIIAGGTVFVPFVTGGSQYFLLARYLTNGTLDTTFGNNGEVITQVEFDTSAANALALEPDGKIIAAGQTMVGTNNQYAAVRYNSDGSLDTSYGNAGVVAFSFNDGGSDAATATAIDSTGRVILAGTANNLFGIARLINGNPALKISLAAPNTVFVSWPGAATGWTLQQNNNLNGGTWATSGVTVTNNNGTNSFTATASGAKLFYRLVSP